MAAEKREQNASRNNGGSQNPQGGRGADSGVGSSIRGAAADAGQRVMDGVETARQETAHVYRRAEGMIARHPAPSLATSFGIGFGIGMVIALILTQREETWTERNIPDSWRNLPDRLRNMHVPDALARHMPSR